MTGDVDSRRPASGQTGERTTSAAPAPSRKPSSDSDRELLLRLSERTELLQLLRKQASENERELQDLRDELERAKSQAAKTRKVQGGRKRRIKALESQLGASVKELQKRERALAERSVEFTEAKDRLARRDRRLEALEKRLQRSEAEAERFHAIAEPPFFFVVGHAKSGTSWLMRILDSHPEIMCKGEGRILGRHYKRPDLERITTETIPPSSLYRAMIDAEYLKAWVERSVWTRDDEPATQLDGLTRAVTHHLLGRRLAESGKRIVGDKTPLLHKDVVAEAARLFPTAKVVHIIRDGRDVAVSFMHHLWNRELDLADGRDLEPDEAVVRDTYREDPAAWLASGQGIFSEERLRFFAESWRDKVVKASADGQELLGDSYVELRYENLNLAPTDEVRRLLEFLGASAEPGAVEAAIGSAEFENWSGGRKRGAEDSTALLRKGVVGDWQVVFTERDRQIFKDVAGELLLELGYERNAQW